MTSKSYVSPEALRLRIKNFGRIMTQIRYLEDIIEKSDLLGEETWKSVNEVYADLIVKLPVEQYHGCHPVYIVNRRQKDLETAIKCYCTAKKIKKAMGALKLIDAIEEDYWNAPVPIMKEIPIITTGCSAPNMSLMYVPEGNTRTEETKDTYYYNMQMERRQYLLAYKIKIEKNCKEKIDAEDKSWLIGRLKALKQECPEKIQQDDWWKLKNSMLVIFYEKHGESTVAGGKIDW